MKYLNYLKLATIATLLMVSTAACGDDDNDADNDSPENPVSIYSETLPGLWMETNQTVMKSEIGGTDTNVTFDGHTYRYLKIETTDDGNFVFSRLSYPSKSLLHKTTVRIQDDRIIASDGKNLGKIIKLTNTNRQDALTILWTKYAGSFSGNSQCSVESSYQLDTWSK